MINNINVIQNNNEYLFYTPQNICIAHLILPPDGQYAMDAKLLAMITKPIAQRWGVIQRQDKISS